MSNVSLKFNRSLDEDFIEILSRTKDIWLKNKNKNFFLTGCTGFFGYWLVRTFIEANKKYNLNINLYILTRKKKNLINKFFKNKIINFIIGDIRDFKYPPKKIDFIIHGATTSAEETFNKQDPLEKFSIMVDGTNNILNFTKKNKCKRFLYISSGSVYGDQFKSKIREIDYANLNNYRSSFDINVLGKSKKKAEKLVMSFSKKYKFITSIARCFTFVGPTLPLNIHYAVGNFLKQKSSNKNIVLNSSGNSVRSFMYMTDLVVWLFYIFFKGKNRNIYNVGSDKSISIKNLAKLINKLEKNKSKIIIKKNVLNENKTYYVPSVNKAKKALNLNIKHDLRTSLKKTYLNIIKNKKYYNI